MANLSLALLGPFQVTLDGQSLPGLTLVKARALLAFLAVEADRAHSREALATLLWPESPTEAAFDSLRHALAHLRQALGDRHATPPFLVATRQALRLNPAADLRLDVASFRALLDVTGEDRPGVERLEEAMSLYRGDFLAGFTTSDSPPFDDWLVVQREALARQALLALERLAQVYQSAGDYPRAEACLRRQLALEPWREEAHRELMRLLAFTGQRSAALSQYETCRRVLKDELGVEPALETAALYERIREGNLGAQATLLTPRKGQIPQHPARSTLHPAQHPSRRFVGRERELAWLGASLEAAASGQGRVAFVIGEAGSGKTALLAEFAGRALQRHGDLVVAQGSCNAQTGIGDPYLPFREILQLLTSDVEAKRAADSITPEGARRLWALLPEALQALVDSGPDLLDTFVPGRALLARAQALGPSGTAPLARLERLLQRKSPRPSTGPQQGDLFEQLTRVLQQLARRQTLLLVVDDMQWADRGSISLLFHLGRRLASSRIMVLGAYRPDDVSLGRGGERHPLEPVVNELGREFGAALLDLGQAEGRRFVAELVDAEPNRLGEGFRERLYRRTAGHALFVVELLEGLEERGDLVKDEAGRWVEGTVLDWERLPARAEAAIAERIGRLPKDLQRLLAVASVEGEEFTAEVVARAEGAGERETARSLSGPLGREHRLVVARSLNRVGEQRLSGFRFRHQLFQQYLYNRLDAVERTQLHESVGLALEALHGERAAEMAVQLARHFELAGLAEKAVAYLLQAGNRAAALLAYEQAIASFRHALALLPSLPEGPGRTQREIDLQLALGAALDLTPGFGADERRAAYERASELCGQLSGTAQLAPALFLLATTSMVKSDYRHMVTLAEQILRLHAHDRDPLGLALGYCLLGNASISQGELAAGRDYLEQALALYEPESHGWLTALLGQDFRLACTGALAPALDLLGYRDQGLWHDRQALAIAREQDQPTVLVFAVACSLNLHQARGEAADARERVETLLQLASEKGQAAYGIWGMVGRGRLWIEEGRVDEGLAEMQRGLAAWRAAGVTMSLPQQLCVVAEGCVLAGRVADGLAAVAEGLALAEAIGTCPYEAELHRLRGGLLLLRHEDAEAEACFQRAIQVARRQEAKTWELRAATGLARLWQRQGKGREACELLAAVYGWFTEGFDTLDLREAKALLAELPGIAV